MDVDNLFAFSELRSENTVHNMIFSLLLFALIAPKKIQRLSVSLATSLLTGFLTNRWFQSGHPPLSNLYESLLFLSWIFLIFYVLQIYFEWTGQHIDLRAEPKLLETNKKIFNAQQIQVDELRSNQDNKFVRSKPAQLSEAQLEDLGCVSSTGQSLSSSYSLDIRSSSVRTENAQEIGPTLLDSSSGDQILKNTIGFLFLATALFLFAFAAFRLPSEMQQLTPLVPALQSNWLLMHVSIMLLSYSSLLAGCLLAMTFLIVYYFDQSTFSYTGGKENVDGKSTSREAEPNSRVLIKAQHTHLSFSLLTALDEYSYKSLSFAFPLLTLGIISGAVWANEAWGSYWSWDPKETWALITWLIFAIYLHVRLNKGWTGKKAAWVASFGFFMIWICYLGVNILGKGLHSYGWWQ